MGSYSALVIISICVPLCWTFRLAPHRVNPILMNAARWQQQHVDPSIINATRQITVDCMNLSDEGSCEFFTCFDRRFQCESNIVKAARFYCNRLNRRVNRLDQVGQDFINKVSMCMTQGLKVSYVASQVSCDRLDHAVSYGMNSCFSENNFCEAYTTNSQQIWRTFLRSDRHQPGADRLYFTFLMAADGCVVGDQLSGWIAQLSPRQAVSENENE